MKNVKKVLLICILFISLFIITGCGNDSIVGKYKIIEVNEGEIVIKGESLEKSKLNFTFTIKKDGTAILDMIDEKENLKYDDECFYSKDDKSDKMPYTYKDGKIILTEDDMKMIFEKE